MDLLDRFYSREDYHQSIQYAKVMEAIGWSSIPIGGSQIFVKKLGPVSLAKLQRPSEINFHQLESLRKKLKIIHLIIEPKAQAKFLPLNLEKKGYRESKEHFAHSKTAILDLSTALDEVIRSFPSKARYNIKLSQKQNILYTSTVFSQVTNEVRAECFALHDAWSKEKKVSGYSNDFLSHVMDGFSEKGWLLTAKLQQELVGAMWVIIHDRIAYYFYTFTSKSGRNVHVPTGLLYEALIVAKNEGADIFDFCSVYDERYPKDNLRWKGFTEFKSRFAPIEVYYPPTFHRWL